MEHYTYKRNRKILKFRIFTLKIRKAILKIMSIICVKALSKLSALRRRTQQKLSNVIIKNEGITLHITKVVPLDPFILKIEFTVNRRDTYCYHIESPENTYAEMLTKHKREEDYSDLLDMQQLYATIRFTEANWKLIKLKTLK